MRLKQVVVTFSEQEVQDILSIDMDCDEKEALNFIQKVVAKRIKEALRPHCVPVFEESYSPRQKENFETPR